MQEPEGEGGSSPTGMGSREGPRSDSTYKNNARSRVEVEMKSLQEMTRGDMQTAATAGLERKGQTPLAGRE